MVCLFFLFDLFIYFFYFNGMSVWLQCCFQLESVFSNLFGFHYENFNFPVQVLSAKLQ